MNPSLPPVRFFAAILRRLSSVPSHSATIWGARQAVPPSIFIGVYSRASCARIHQGQQSRSRRGATSAPLSGRPPVLAVRIGARLPKPQVFQVVVVLVMVGLVSPGCQAGGKAPQQAPLQIRGVEAAAPTANIALAVTPSATATALDSQPAASEMSQSVPPQAPIPWGTPGALTAENAASRVIDIPKASIPKGPRKPPPNRLIIPSVGVDAKVIELGTYHNENGELVWETAPFAAGHHQGTANPGELGNVVISGHISSIREGAVFKNLPKISVGDGIVVATSDRNYVYRVTGKEVVEPTYIQVMNSTGEEMLTLITCVPDGIYTHRLIVTAKRT